MWARTFIDVAIVAGSVQLSKDGKVIRLRPLPASRRPTPGGLRLGPGLRSLTVWPGSGLGEDGREAPPRRGGSCSTVFAHRAFCRSPTTRGGLMPSPMPTITLPSSEEIPVLGQGTWHLAENRARRPSEIAALRHGLDVSMNLIDTAEMYADGEAEILVGEAIAGRREQVFLVSKVLPRHATRQGTARACEASLRRLGTDRLDLYLLHWRGPVPLEETVEAFMALQAGGLIRNWGVSNFDVGDMAELLSLPGGNEVQTDQVLYNLSRRAPEFELLPICQELNIPIMAYSPIEQGRILGRPVLRDIAARRDASPVQVALAWVLRQDGVCAIPRASNPDHVDENRAALDVELDRDDLAALDAEFPPPLYPQPLEML
jgi:diketogulonate reductase-like aldo/keto reductase